MTMGFATSPMRSVGEPRRVPGIALAGWLHYLLVGKFDCLSWASDCVSR